LSYAEKKSANYTFFFSQGVCKDFARCWQGVGKDNGLAGACEWLGNGLVAALE